MALFLMDTSLPENLHLVRNIKKEALGSGVWEAFLEAAPQFILQSFIVLKTGNISKFEIYPKEIASFLLQLKLGFPEGVKIS